MTNPACKASAMHFKALNHRAGGVVKAADIVETVVATGQPVLAKKKNKMHTYT
ncbi:hypothetical protein AB0758_46620 [Tolypothrix bouteillei VB521301_2]